jgi:hypothetical protein
MTQRNALSARPRHGDKSVVAPYQLNQQPMRLPNNFDGDAIN